jgi:hypothetical protein
MKTLRFAAVFLCAAFLSADGARAQSYGEAVEESNREFKESMAAMGEFVKDVNFNESDVKSVIANWHEMTALGEESDDGGVVEGGDEEETVNFQELLAYPAYRSWAKAKGLDPDTWLKKFMRVQVMMMKESVADGASDGADQMRQQIAELEMQRAQMGEEMYGQMKAALEAGAAAMSSVGSAYSDLPEPTSSEKKLLEQYSDQFMNLE